MQNCMQTEPWVYTCVSMETDFRAKVSCCRHSSPVPWLMPRAPFMIWSAVKVTWPQHMACRLVKSFSLWLVHVKSREQEWFVLRDNFGKGDTARRVTWLPGNKTELSPCCALSVGLVMSSLLWQDLGLLLAGAVATDSRMSLDLRQESDVGLNTRCGLSLGKAGLHVEVVWFSAPWGTSANTRSDTGLD